MGLGDLQIRFVVVVFFFTFSLHFSQLCIEVVQVIPVSD